MIKKFKYIFLFILFLFVLFGFSNVNGFTGKDGNTYPTYTIAENEQSIYLFDTSSNTLTVYIVPADYCIGYKQDFLNNTRRIIFFNNTNGKYYTPTKAYMSVFDGTIFSNWSVLSGLKSNYLLSATTNIVYSSHSLVPYASYNMELVQIVSTLPEDILLSDNIFIVSGRTSLGVLRIYLCVIPDGANLYFNSSKNTFVCKVNKDSANIPILTYQLSFVNNGLGTWSAPTSLNEVNTAYDKIDGLSYNSMHVYDITTGLLIINSQKDLFLKEDVKDLPRILTSTDDLIAGTYENLMAVAPSRYDILDFEIFYEDEFSGREKDNMPLLNRCFASFSEGSYLNGHYITKYLDYTVIRMPLIDIIPKDNTYYRIYFLVLDTSTGQFYEIDINYITSFSDEGKINIQNIINSNPNKEVVSAVEEGFKEMEKTNKGILQTLVDLPGNLIKGLIDGIVGIFIPGDDFFNNWFAEMNEWLGDRFGILYYPIEVVIDFLTRIGNIQDTGNYTLSFSDVKLMGHTLIPAFSFDFNSLLNTQIFKHIHTIYILIMDAVLYIFLIITAKNVAIEVFGGFSSNIGQMVGDVRGHFSAKDSEASKR